MPDAAVAAARRVYVGVGSLRDVDDVRAALTAAGCAKHPASPTDAAFWVLSLHASAVGVSRFPSVAALLRWLGGT